MMKLNELWALEWSPAQKAYRIEKLEDAVRKNLTAFLNDWPGGGYIIIFVGGENEARVQYDTLSEFRSTKRGQR